VKKSFFVIGLLIRISAFEGTKMGVAKGAFFARAGPINMKNGKNRGKTKKSREGLEMETWRDSRFVASKF
jgi:hypothetical protein